jgi:hypothetical protein
MASPTNTAGAGSGSKKAIMAPSGGPLKTGCVQGKSPQYPGSALFGGSNGLLCLSAFQQKRESGIFRLVGHPVYGGAILIGLGWSLADAPLGPIPTALLALLFDLKARREEAWLIERFPAYAAYRAGTPRRFVPWLY